MTDTNDILAFPKGFLWGSATASHQVEGGNTNNDWHLWEQGKGHIRDGTRAGLASDWWGSGHGALSDQGSAGRAEEDLGAASQLGQNTHRLSLEWSRLEPDQGTWSRTAVERYRQILRFLGDKGMTPMITLHHFTLPLWAADQGGWENEGSVGWFTRYVELCFDAFGDLCNLWCTINEPLVYATYGYLFGLWPPGRGGLSALRRVVRNQAQAHASAYEAIHWRRADALVGYATHLRLFDPASDRWPDRAAAKLTDYIFNQCGLAAFRDGTLLFPFGWALDGRPRSGEKLVDFVGLNYYSRDMVALDLRRPRDLFMRRFANPNGPYSMDGWGEIYPEGLYRALLRMGQEGAPVYLTEFGVPDNEDRQRPRFIIEHVAAMYHALREGIPLKGAYFWSLVDNFEWAAGWSARFGLISLDPQTQERRLTRSAEVYARIARANGLERSLVAEVAPDLLDQLWPGAS
jgi:beta-glucosidase